MALFRVKLVEQRQVAVTYLVEADDGAAAEQLARQGAVAPERAEILEPERSWLKTIGVTADCWPLPGDQRKPTQVGVPG